MKITKIQFKRYQDRINEIENDELPKASEKLKAARALGDLSENAEYDSAREEVSKLKSERAELLDLLKSDIVDYDTSDNITVGSLVNVESPSLPDKLLLLVADKGDAIIEGILSTGSALGRSVIGNKSGNYKVNGELFIVTKIKEPNIEEFIQAYPSEKKLIKNLFDEVDYE